MAAGVGARASLALSLLPLPVPLPSAYRRRWIPPPDSRLSSRCSLTLAALAVRRRSRVAMSDEELDEDQVSVNDGGEYEGTISDEDTEDASETDMLKYDGEYTEIKEQIYQDKLAGLKDQLRQVETLTHPEYVKRVSRVKQVYEERLILNDAFLEFETKRINDEYSNEKRLALKEFEERKADLKESIIAELEERRRQIESERTTIELTNEGCEPKPVTTRKLRRRPNDPVPLPEKRKRGPPTTLNQLLEDSEINEDIKNIAKGASKYR